MVDPINNTGPISTLLRAQAAGAPTVTAANSQRPTQTLINQNANGAKPTTVQPSFKASGAPKGDNLPRGSIVDILA